MVYENIILSCKKTKRNIILRSGEKGYIQLSSQKIIIFNKRFLFSTSMLEDH